jgi:succinoglycan biosynthesis transport protein ExoP
MNGQELILRDRAELSTVQLAPRNLIEVIFRRRRTISYTFAAVIGGAILAVVLLPSKYEAQTKLLLHRERVDPPLTAQQTGVMQQAAPSLTEEDINSEVGLLRSQDLLEKVVIATGLDRRVKPSLLSRLLSKEPLTPEERRAKATEKLAADLRIEPEKKSYLIDVSYASPDPQLSAQVLNTLGNYLLDKHAEVRRTPGTAQFFDDETQQYKQKLDQAQQRLAAFNQKEGLVTEQSEKDASVPRMAEFEFNLRQTQAAIPRAEENVRNLEAQLRTTQPRITTELRNSDNAVLMQQLKSSLVNLELQHTDLIQKYAPDDRQVKEVEEQIGQVKTAIETHQKAPLKEEVTNENPTYELLHQELVKARAELASLKALATSYSKVDTSYRGEAVERDQKQLEQQSLLRDLKTAEQSYLLYLNKREEARISDAFDRMRIVNVSIAEAATAPMFPNNPASLTLVLAAILGCLLSAGLVFVQEQIDGSLRSPEQVEAYLGVPVLAAMPHETSGSLRLPRSLG